MKENCLQCLQQKKQKQWFTACKLKDGEQLKVRRKYKMELQVKNG